MTVLKIETHSHDLHFFLSVGHCVILLRSQGGAVAACLVHDQEVESSILSPASNLDLIDPTNDMGILVRCPSNGYRGRKAFETQLDF